jgi:transposase
MAYLFKKKVRGLTYWYLGENKKVDGVSRRIWQKYLGTANVIKDRVEGTCSDEIDVLEFGIVASTLVMGDELNFVDTVNKVLPKRVQGLSIGEHLLLTIANRIDEPLSKNQFSNWYEHTMLKRRFVVKASCLSSQDFWNHWKKISQEHIDKIQEALLEKILSLVSVKELVFDPTNFTTYIEEHRAQKMAQFGHAKSGVNGLRQVNLSLLVTKEGGIPLWHHTYDGNINDVTEFREFITSLTTRIAYFSKQCKNITLIFDKGNNSQTNIKNVDKKLHFYVVGSLKPSEHRDLFDIPLEEFNEEYVSKSDEKTFCAATTKNVYDGMKKIVVTYNETLKYNQKLRTDKAINKAINQLENLKSRIIDSTKTRDELLIKVSKIADKPYLRGLIPYTLEKSLSGFDLSFDVDQQAYEQRSKAFGKNILFTDNLSLETDEIVKLYHDKNIVEEQIKNLKDTHVIRFTPMWCWTDHMIRVHAFTCVMALLFLRLLMKRVDEAKLGLSQDQTLDHLKKIKLALLKSPTSEKVTVKLTRLNDTQRTLVNHLNLRRYV